MKNNIFLLFLLSLFALTTACELTDEEALLKKNEEEMEEEEEMTSDTIFFRGADLSYVNEMQDCGAVYANRAGDSQDPYQIFSTAGTDLVRIRLWHNADWTEYSDYEDVKRSIQRAKAEGMQVLLDFHNSDDWADPGRQHIPAAWLAVADNTSVLGDSLYNYIYGVLSDLNDANLLPEMVQMGNEINAEILQDPNGDYNSINWTRNANLINRGLQAIRDASADFGTDIQSMLHIAQPENALWWFEQATQNGINNYDWIGLSFYPVWSDYTLQSLPSAIEELVRAHNKRVMVVETAYPFQLQNNDNANNILGNDALIAGYPASEQGQFDFLVDLEASIIAGGGEGLIYWEPAWVSTDCYTQWAQGSHWDNATLFDNQNRALLGLSYYGH